MRWTLTRHRFSHAARGAIGSAFCRPAAACALVALALLAAGPTRAFSPWSQIYFSAPGVVDVQTTFERAARWGAEPVGGAGLHDGIQVAVEPGFAGKLGVTDPAEVALLHGAVVAAFRAWESPVLSFEVFFDAAAEEGPGGFEIDLFAVDGPVGLDENFGWADFNSHFVLNRLLTNGQRFYGEVITDADIFLNRTNIAWFQSEIPLNDEGRLAAFQRLIMHELGHALGLGHPTVDPYSFDSDLDPMTVVVVDPDDPFAALTVSPNLDWDAIMSGLRYGSSWDALLFTELRPDDASGRNVLYPAPEPGLLPMLGSVFAALAALRRRK
jgi:hypothetical protein